MMGMFNKWVFDPEEDAARRREALQCLEDNDESDENSEDDLEVTNETTI